MPLTPIRLVTLGNGRTATCPTGAAPQANLIAVSFTPPPTADNRLTRGTYHVTLHAALDNETTAAITVQAITVTIGGQQWQPPVRVPDSVPAESATDLTLDGTYLSPGDQPATVIGLLDWQWQSTDLRPCGHAGLVHH